MWEKKEGTKESEHLMLKVRGELAMAVLGFFG